MKPYYEEAGITIYHGDCCEILPSLSAESIITDPVWPNSVPTLIGWDRPYELFAEAAAHFPRAAQRAVIHLGCDSDPRFLLGVPREMPFFRMCYLRYACPVRKGRVLYGGDVAYVFGVPPKSAPGRRVISGEYLTVSTRPDAARVKLIAHKEYGKAVPGLHPTPRRLQHVRWLVAKLAGDSVIDPFCGSGTTLVACAAQNIPAIGIEIEERYCEIAVKRLAQRVFDLQETA